MNKQEVVGESVKDPGKRWEDKWEGVFDAVVRGCREELGSPGLNPVKIICGERKTFTTMPGRDEILAFQPYLLLQQVIGPQPWVGPGFVVVVPEDFEPKPDTEGEVGSHRWCNPAELWDELHANPSSFMGLHYPLLLQVCEDIVTGRLKI